DVLPRLAAVDGAVKPALLVRPPEVPDRGDEGDVRVLRVDGDAADVVRVLQPAARPRLAAVGALVDALAPAHRVPRVALAGADVDHLWLALADGDRAGALGRQRVGNRLEAGSAVGRLPHAAAGRGDVERVRVALDGDDVRDPAAHVGRADAPGLQPGEDRLVQ